MTEPVALAACDQARTRLDSFLDPGFDAFGFAEPDQRADFRGLVRRVAGDQLGGDLHELPEECLENVLVDKDALNTDAGLSGVTEGRVRGAVGGIVEIGPIAVNDQRRIAAEFKQNALAAGVRLQLPAHLCGAGEADELDAIFFFREPGSVGIASGRTARASSGQPALRITSPSASAVNGVCGAGLIMIGQPAAIAGAALWATRFSGKLKGVMASTGPTGKRCTSPQRFSLPSVRSRGMRLAAKPGGFFGSGLEGEHGAVDFSPRQPDRLAGFGNDELRKAILLLDESGCDVFEDLAALPARQRAGAAHAGDGMVHGLARIGACGHA